MYLCIKNEAVSHFQKFLQMQPDDGNDYSIEELQELLTYRCTEDTAAGLVAPVEGPEILAALKPLPNDKVSGLDGFTKEFYIGAWSVIGRDFITAVQSFFMFGFMPRGVNATILTLIPKVIPANTMKDYRPIACCNILYKVISKILAKRLKLLLPEAIAPNQSAFIKGRLLLENILLASELVNGYHKTSLSTRCSIKFDISNAFDTVKWSFIVNVLKAMALPDIFIHWIYLFISTASFSVAVNGALEGFFTSARGIRQGCSLSPYLYVILNNVLYQLLNRSAEEGKFGYHTRCQEVKLTHLSFDDDILVFTDGTSVSLFGVLEVFKDFASMSGLHINPSKSTLFSAGGEANQLIVAAHGVGIQSGTLPIRYLGLPLTTKALTRLDYEPLLNRIRNQFLLWSHKSLSYAGRLQLIKTVITSFVNFWSSVFILPKSCYDEIESMCNAFLWSGSPHDKHKAKVAWETVCSPKSEGGLGLQRFKDTARVFALNLIWRIFTLAGSLWVAWIKRYLLRGKSFWTVREMGNGYWIWQKLLKLRDIACQFLRIEVKDGLDTFFWHDNWLHMGKLIDITWPAGPNLLGIPLNAKVADALGNEQWRARCSRGRQFPALRNAILSLPFDPGLGDKDKVLWRHSQQEYCNSFSASYTWEQIRQVKPIVSWERVIWFAQGVPRFSFIVWLAIWNRLSTGDRMRSWGQTQCCMLCGEPDETRNHLYFACPYSFTRKSSFS